MFSLQARGDKNFQFQNSNFNGNRNQFSGDRRRIPRYEANGMAEEKQLSRFVWAHNHLVDNEILERLNIGDDEAMAVALEQIHLRSIEEAQTHLGRQQYGYPGFKKSYSEALNSQARKLKVKSNRGRPRKISSKHRNPFEIGGGFKRRSKGRAKGKVTQKGKRNFAASQVIQVVPTAVVGSSVKQALEILEAAENMGLAVNGDRVVVVKEIARKLEMNEL
ncbi:hypothetical protein ACET3Z_007903 [Daucus carota]